MVFLHDPPAASACAQNRQCGNEPRSRPASSNSNGGCSPRATAFCVVLWEPRALRLQSAKLGGHPPRFGAPLFSMRSAYFAGWTKQRIACIANVLRGRREISPKGGSTSVRLFCYPHDLCRAPRAAGLLSALRRIVGLVPAMRSGIGAMPACGECPMMRSGRCRSGGRDARAFDGPSNTCKRKGQRQQARRAVPLHAWPFSAAPNGVPRFRSVSATMVLIARTSSADRG